MCYQFVLSSKYQLMYSHWSITTQSILESLSHFLGLQLWGTNNHFSPMTFYKGLSPVMKKVGRTVKTSKNGHTLFCGLFSSSLTQLIQKVVDSESSVLFFFQFLLDYHWRALSYHRIQEEALLSGIYLDLLSCCSPRSNLIA